MREREKLERRAKRRAKTTEAISLVLYGRRYESRSRMGEVHGSKLTVDGSRLTVIRSLLITDNR